MKKKNGKLSKIRQPMLTDADLQALQEKYYGPIMKEMERANRPQVTIDEVTAGGVWIRRGNRLRFINCTPEELAQINLDSLEKTRRNFKEGNIEKVVYFRDENGKIGIPAEPDMIPDGCMRLEAESLGDLDRLSAEMAAENYAQFQDNGAFTEFMEDRLGNPRKALISQMMNPKSELERDTIRLILQDFDKEESDRQKIQSSTFFHHREYDR